MNKIVFTGFLLFFCLLSLPLPSAIADTTFQIATCYYGEPNDDPAKSRILGEQQAIVIVGNFFTRHEMLQPEDWCVGPYEDNRDYMKCERGKESADEQNTAVLRRYYARQDGGFTHERAALQKIQISPRKCRSELSRIKEIQW